MYWPNCSLSEHGSLPSSEMLYICLCDAAICGGECAAICEGLALFSLNFHRKAGKNSALPLPTTA